MSIPLENGDFTGEVETAWVMSVLKELCGGRAWETFVPDKVDLAAETDGGVKPYLIARFAEPFESTQGRKMAGGEQEQPQIFQFTVSVFGNDADSVREAMLEVRRRLVGLRPSLTASQLRARGGFSYGNTDASARPTRFERGAFFRCIINH